MSFPPQFTIRRVAGMICLIVVALVSTGVALSAPAGTVPDEAASPSALVLGGPPVLLVDDSGPGLAMRKGRARIKAGRLGPSTNRSQATSSVAIEALADPSATLGDPIVKQGDGVNPAPPTTVLPENSRFETLPPGSVLPSGEWCASRVRPTEEIRPENDQRNATRGTDPNDVYPRVDGDFVGTTDEILQWAACKWGIDEDVVRAQAVKESGWRMSFPGDPSSDQSMCHPEVRTSQGPCPQSVGLMQVKFNYHGSAYEGSNAIRSTAYNVDYTYAVWRECYEGRTTWLNTVDRGREYGPGDLEGCLGRWFAGRWYTSGAVNYINQVNEILRSRRWETTEFIRWG